MTSELNKSHGKISGFISFSLFKFFLVIKLRNFNGQRLWILLIFSDLKNRKSDLNKFHEKMFDFVSFPLFGFTLVKKLRNFDFENHWNTLKPKHFGGKTSAEISSVAFCKFRRKIFRTDFIMSEKILDQKNVIDLVKGQFLRDSLSKFWIRWPRTVKGWTQKQRQYICVCNNLI